MEQITVNSILIGVLTLFISLIVYVFINSNKSLSQKIDDNKTAYEKELTHIAKEVEMLDLRFREFENVKFQEIMTALNGLITDVAVIKSEMVNIQKQLNAK